MARRKILMLTNAELGQANIFIASIYALKQRDPGIEIHVASFAALEVSLREALNDAAADVSFHRLPGRPMFECFKAAADPRDNIHAVSLRKPGFWNTPDAMRFIFHRAMLPWTPEEYADAFAVTRALINDLAPDLVLVDCLLSPALSTACYMRQHEGKTFKLAILSPNTLKDFAHTMEPRGAVLWKWPVLCSGLPMPLTGWDVLLNMYLVLRMLWMVVTDRTRTTLLARVRELTGTPKLDIVETFSLLSTCFEAIDRVFVGNRPEVDFPQLDLDSPPKDYLARLIVCGPILRPLAPIEDELASWLRRRPVLLINLGTHCTVSEAEALDMARSVRTLLDEAARRWHKEDTSEMQVLWKLKKDLTRGPDFDMGPGSAMYDLLGAELDADRLRIVDWLSAEPNSILNTGQVRCVVHHGGANSYHEAVWYVFLCSNSSLAGTNVLEY
jgi:hypothetical protein